VLKAVPRQGNITTDSREGFPGKGRQGPAGRCSFGCRRCGMEPRGTDPAPRRHQPLPAVPSGSSEMWRGHR